MKIITYGAVLLTLLPGATCIAGHYDENELGTLFTTPQQRQKIDSFRKGKSTGVGREQVSPSDVKIQGMVKRSNGKSVVWVNGQNTINSSRVGGVSVNKNSINSQSNRVTVTIDDTTVRLKPGQVWSEESNKVTDTY